MIFAYSDELPRRVVSRVIETKVGLSSRLEAWRLLRRSAPRNDSDLRRHCERSEAILTLHAGTKASRSYRSFTVLVGCFSLFWPLFFRCYFAGPAGKTESFRGEDQRLGYLSG